jgi:hypothetical protein
MDVHHTGGGAGMEPGVRMVALSAPIQHHNDKVELP